MKPIKLITPKKYVPEKVRFDLLVPSTELVSTGFIVGVTTYVTGRKKRK